MMPMSTLRRLPMRSVKRLTETLAARSNQPKMKATKPSWAGPRPYCSASQAPWAIMICMAAK